MESDGLKQIRRCGLHDGSVKNQRWFRRRRATRAGDGECVSVRGRKCKNGRLGAQQIRDLVIS